MKPYFMIILALFILGCGGGGDGAPSSQVPVVVPLTPPADATALPLLIVQVEFNDQRFASSSLTWQQKIFGDAEGQLNNYYLEVSQNNFLFIPAKEDEYTLNDGVIKVILNQDHPVSLDLVDQQDRITLGAILVDALTKSDPYIDFASYDQDANGKIDTDELQLMFLFAGGEAATGALPGIWAHSSCFTAGPSFDAISLMECGNGSYTVFGERHFDIVDGHDATIGIIAHELGHGAFNLPDLYDADGGSEGIGNFGLMGAGSWGYEEGEKFGETPVHMSAWTKMQTGFVIPQLLSTDTNNLAMDASNLNSYKPLRLNTQDPNEYFLIENRSSSGYDAGLYILDEIPFPGGLAIWHIDETQTDNDNENRKLVDLEEADGFHLDTTLNRGNITNLFYSGNNVFTPNSLPADSGLYDGSNTNISITNISASAPIMYIDLAL